MTLKNRFFSLIELLTVMAVIAILLAITIGIFSLVRDKMNNSKTRAVIKQLDIAMQSYKIDQGYYFPQSTAFANLPPISNIDINRLRFNLNKNVDTTFFKNFEYQSLVGSKMITTYGTDSCVQDAWGNKILYKCPGDFNTQMFDIGSLGRDGQYGDNSNNASDFGKGDDITNFNNN